MNIVPLSENYRATVDETIREKWAGPVVVTRGVAHDTRELPGLVCERNGKLMGVVLYHIEGTSCEIVLMEALVPGRGIGTAIIEHMKNHMISEGCTKMWLITTNDNLPAIGFYYRRGFSITNVYLNAVAESRKIKPNLPETGLYGIKIEHEVELTLEL